MSALPEQIQRLVDEADSLRDEQRAFGTLGHPYGLAEYARMSAIVERMAGIAHDVADALVDAYARPAEDAVADVVAPFLNVPDRIVAEVSHDVARAILARFPSVGRRDETVSSACDSPCESQSAANADRKPSALTQGADAAVSREEASALWNALHAMNSAVEDAARDGDLIGSDALRDSREVLKRLMVRVAPDSIKDHADFLQPWPTVMASDEPEPELGRAFEGRVIRGALESLARDTDAEWWSDAEHLKDARGTLLRTVAFLDSRAVPGSSPEAVEAVAQEIATVYHGKINVGVIPWFSFSDTWKNHYRANARRFLAAALRVPVSSVPVTPVGDLVTTWRKWSDSFRAQGNPPANTAADYIAQCANELEAALAVPVGDVDAEKLIAALTDWADQREEEHRTGEPHDEAKQSRTKLLRDAAKVLFSRPREIQAAGNK